MHRVLFENVTVIQLVMIFAVNNAVPRHVMYCCVLLATMKGRIRNEGGEETTMFGLEREEAT
jgi:hypothetical protein